jgi:two-component system, NtrC family, response regulator HydG
MSHESAARTAPQLKVLVVEDDADVADQLAALVREWGFATRVSGSGRAVRATMRDWVPDLALVDLGLPDIDGMDLLRELRTKDVESVVISGRPSVAIAVDSVALGAWGVLEKPVSPCTLRSVLELAERRRSFRAATSPRNPDGPDTLGELVSASHKMYEVFDLVRCVAPTDANVLITGEHGTGKELVANALHALSPRQDGPFIKINCAAIPEELMESELFGHRRGAFTGAVADRTGLFEAAAGGTLLLDEIGEMSPHLQSKLLRVLQERQARPVGGLRAVDLDFRLICATNSDLRTAATRGRFRQDLYFRINTIGIAVPPLRDRPEDIPLLASHLLARFSRRYGRNLSEFEPAASEALAAHPWRGNVRELEHAIEHAVVVSRGARITLEDLPDALQPQRRVPLPATQPMLPLAELERQAILRTLEHTRGNKRAAAAILGVYRPTLYSKLRKYRIFEAPLGRDARQVPDTREDS